ncbi:MAG: diguanylate cyclase [Lachnospiraceae bacterium]|nr:diguanylate cyclase [Lachnospiraceae bacterium]
MKKIAIFLDNASNHAIYARISGLFQTVYEENLDMALYLFRSRGAWKFDEEYNYGEYNIFRLPDLSMFDGFVVIFNDLSDDRRDFIGWKACWETIRRIRATGKPAISIGAEIEGFHHVGIDNIASMTVMMRHLAEVHRARSFWFFMGPEGHRENSMRVQAIRDYLAGWDDRDYSEFFYYDSFNPSCGENGFRTFYERYGTLPDAIVCANDHIAIGACTEAEKRGFQCPRDFLITGFDNIDMASFHTPSLTTIDQNWSALGRVCIEYFTAYWAGEEFPRSTVVCTQMIHRTSCGCGEHLSEDTPSLINAFIHRNMELESFNRRLIRLENDLMLCASVREIGEIFAQILPYLHCDSLYLVLDRRFSSEREQARLLKDSINGAETEENLFMREGYPPEMQIGFIFENGKLITKDEPVERMYSEYIDRPAPKDCMFLPVHFGDRSAGYIVIGHAEHMIRNSYLTRAIQMLLSAIENLYIRSRLKSANNLLSRASITDAMTGFYNRMGYQEVAIPFFQKHQQEGNGLAVLFADMNGMKLINDRYGHECGDQAILSITQAIRRVCPQEAIMARMGGDEFLIIVEETDRRRVEELIGNIRDEVPRTEAARQLPYPPTLSIGYILTEADSGRSLDDYVRLSDERMYEQKRIIKERMASQTA